MLFRFFPTPIRMKLRILAAAAILAAGTSPCLHAQWWNPQDPTPPKARGTPMAPKITYTPHVRQMAYMAVNAAIWNDDWAKIDRMYEEFMAEGLRATDGSYFVEAVQSVFHDHFTMVVDAKARDEMARWEAAVPASRLRPAIRVVMLESQAWNARGGGSTGVVPGEAAQIFRQKLVAATRALEETEAVGKDSPIWWWAALIVAGSSGRSEAQFDAMFAEATKRFPSYQPLYYTRVNYLLPQWGGDWARVESFANRSTKAGSTTDGEAMYAWIYVDLSRKTPDLFADSQLSWPHMKKAFEDLVARYPDPNNRNLFATFACRARDKETTAKLLAELGAQAKLGAYSEGYTTESCRRFALAPA